MGTPSYCQSRQYADPSTPLALKPVDVMVPKCANRPGRHGRHRVRIYTAGEGIPLVIAGGYTGDVRIYKLMLGLLALRFKVIAVDLAGHGGTAELRNGFRVGNYADLLVCTLREMGVDRAVFLGHSFGGRVAAEAASRNPELVIAHVMVNAIMGPDWDARVAATQTFPPYAANSIWHLVRGAVQMRDRLPSTDQSTELLALSAQVYRRYLWAPWHIVPAGVAILTAPSSRPVCDRLRQQHVPTIVVWGNSDPLVTEHDARMTAQRCDAQLVIVPDAGHYLPLQCRRTLPDLLDLALAGQLTDGVHPGLDQILDREVRAHGLDPASATPAQVMKACFPGPDREAGPESTNPFAHMPVAA